MIDVGDDVVGTNDMICSSSLSLSLLSLSSLSPLLLLSLSNLLGDCPKDVEVLWNVDDSDAKGECRCVSTCWLPPSSLFS